MNPRSLLLEEFCSCGILLLTRYCRHFDPSHALCVKWCWDAFSASNIASKLWKFNSPCHFHLMDSGQVVSSARLAAESWSWASGRWNPTFFWLGRCMFYGSNKIPKEYQSEDLRFVTFESAVSISALSLVVMRYTFSKPLLLKVKRLIRACFPLVVRCFLRWLTNRLWAQVTYTEQWNSSGREEMLGQRGLGQLKMGWKKNPVWLDRSWSSRLEE